MSDYEMVMRSSGCVLQRRDDLGHDSSLEQEITQGLTDEAGGAGVDVLEGSGFNKEGSEGAGVGVWRLVDASGVAR